MNKDGLRSQEVLLGTLIVKPLHETDDSIGNMDLECQECGAFKFKGETDGSCCSNGKVNLTPFPKPPDALMDLWIGSDDKSKLLRKFSRELNNAVCLSSIQVQEKRFTGFNPSVIFQGKLHHRAGSLIPADGQAPKFAQLYVLDSALESTKRFENLHLPSTVY